MSGYDQIHIPPMQQCMECAKPIGRRWKTGLCRECLEAIKIDRESNKGWTRRHRKPNEE